MISFDAVRTMPGATIRAAAAFASNRGHHLSSPRSSVLGGTHVLAPILSAFALLAAPAAGAPGGDRLEDPLALTISGGVSLGAYEAGLNWALVRFLRLREREFKSDDPRAFLASRGPQLVAVTGASAGSINALLAAALWCEADDSTRNTSVDSNLLRDAWLGVSLDALLPEDPAAYLPEDGVLASAALGPLIADVRRDVFTPGAARFRPGCAIPLGITLTRARPRQSETAGLRASSQRAVLAMVLEVDREGRVRMRRQHLPDRDATESVLALPEIPDPTGPYLDPETVMQALLASAAFPLAFGPRTLCECASACEDEEPPAGAACPGPDAAHGSAGLSCATESMMQAGRELRVCRRRFVDGGVFDNAPVGLAIEQAEEFARPRLFQPITYVFIDPDVRRLRPPDPSQAAEMSAHGATGVLRLTSDLVATARNRELSRTVEARHWNRTSRNLLRQMAAALTDYGALLAQLTNLDAPAAPISPPAASSGSVAERIRMGRVLQSCMLRIATAGPTPEALAVHQACAGAVLGVPGADPLANDAPARAVLDRRLSAPELAAMIRQTVLLSSSDNAVRRSAQLVLENRQAPTDRRTRVAVLLAQRVQIVSAVFAYLADEFPGLTSGSLTDDVLRQLQADLLEVSQRGSTLVSTANRVTNALVEHTLTALARGEGEGAREASAALEELRRRADDALFPAELVLPVVARFRALPAGAPDRNPSSVHLERLLQLRPRLQALAARTTVIQREWHEVTPASGERALFMSSRFSPLTGSQLFNFAGFLDRPLRELDYAAGVYDGLHEVSAAVCSELDPYQQRFPMPARSADGSGQIDPRAEGTQRCIGAVLGNGARELGVLDSRSTGSVFRTLARAELAAWLGSSARAAGMERSAEWSWLGSPQAGGPREPVTAALSVLFARKQPCTELDLEPLCAAELNFDEFLGGLAAAGYQPGSPAMQLAMSDPQRWMTTALRKGLDRTLAIELEPSRRADMAQKEQVLFALAAGELWARGGETRTSGVRLVLDPSTVPGRPVAQGRWLPIVAAHAVPYRLTLDVARGGVALSWLEPALRIGSRFSLLSTVQLVDAELSAGRVSSTFGVRPTVHLGGVSVGGGPRAAVHWSGPGRVDLGAEGSVLVLQDRLGLSFGVRQLSISGGTAGEPFIALTIADLNGAIYWLTPWAAR
jgi:predicted acylesterase/phospholipase RssA